MMTALRISPTYRRPMETLPDLRLSLYDRVASWLLAWLLLAGAVAVCLFIVWLGMHGMLVSYEAVPVALMRDMGGAASQDEIAEDLLLAAPAADEVAAETDLNDPEFQSTLKTVIAAAAMPEAQIRDDASIDEPRRRDGKDGKGSVAAIGGASGKPGIPTHLRWEIDWGSADTLETYARKLDHVRCRHCHQPVELVDNAGLEQIDCPSCGNAVNLSGDATAAYEQKRAIGHVVANSAQTETVDRSADAALARRLVKGHRFGEYELLAEVARGGMGVVYKARHVQLNRAVAIKMLLAGRVATPDEIKRFRVEAAAAAALEHPGIVPIYDFGEHAGRHYFSMAYVPGKSLAARLSAGPLPPRHAAELVRRVAAAVQYAHSRGVIHRDLKPANILLDKLGRPRITDFGLARVMARDSSLTQTGQILGTPSYMPPEQAAGKHDDIGPAADIYSLGAILYHALTGRPPFLSASPIDTVRQVVEQEPVPPRRLNPQVPTDLATITLHCLRKAPRDRYATAQALANDLARYLTDQTIEAQPVGIIDRFATWRARNQQLTRLSSAFGCFISSVAVCVAIILSPAREAAKSVAGQTLVMTFLAPWSWIVGAFVGFVLGGASYWLAGGGRRTAAARAVVQAGVALAGRGACVFIPLSTALAILLFAGVFPGYVVQFRLGRWVVLLMIFGIFWGIRRASDSATSIPDD